MDANTLAVEFRHVSLAFDEKQVLIDISFQLARGGTLILLGATGSGKSVLLKLVAGLLKPDSGDIVVDGEDLVPIPETQLAPYRKRMGIVFQEGALFDSLSVYENVAYPLREAGHKDEREIERRVHEVLGFVEMEHAIEKMPSELSGGMRRRVSVARAIVSQPNLMLYDSPTAGLDPVTANTITVLLAKLRDVGHVSSIVVTQRLQDGYVLANFVYSPEKQALVPAATNGGPPRTPATRFMVLREGRIYFDGTAETLAAAGDAYLRQFLV
ncbi:MAG: ATP-binding cassette domain-containing protein [Terriglobia bacterium]